MLIKHELGSLIFTNKIIKNIGVLLAVFIVLPEINRLQKNNDFKKVFKKSKTFKEDFLLLKFYNNNLAVSRFGFVISKNISKKATVRNKIKRKLSELIRKRLPAIKKGFDAVIIVRSAIKEKNMENFENILNKIFLKANLL